MSEETKTAKEHDMLVRVFDLVAATRQRRWLRTKFNPLSADKVRQLKEGLAEALQTEAAKDIPFREVLLAASGALDKYEATSATVEKKRYTAGYDTFFTTYFEDVPNKKRPRILSKMQKKLYKGLRAQLNK